MPRTDDLRIREMKELTPPSHLIREFGCSDKAATTAADARIALHRILHGQDDRLMVVIGPCSIHDTKAAMEYANRLVKERARFAGELEIVMRVYFEKPRTTVGWKGLIMDPHLDGTNDIPTGLRMARKFLRDVLDLGLPTATEMLDPITPQYIADLTCWSAIGARTTESQTHRQMASGLSMPVGFKNTTSGGVMAAINAIKAAMQPLTFLGIGEDGRASVVNTTGNPACHIILRGGDDGPNFNAEHVTKALELIVKNGLNPSVMIDASHANCSKDYRKMPAVFREILRQRAEGAHGIIGAMLESNLVEGAQAMAGSAASLTYGQSITDSCIDWDTTEALVREVAP